MKAFKLPWRVGPSSAKDALSITSEKEHQDYLPTEPTHFNFFSSQLDSCVEASTIDGLKALYDPLCLLLEDGTYPGLWWLDVTAPSEDDIETLSRIFNLHPLTTEDIKIRENREKIEAFGPYYFLSLRPALQVETHEGAQTSTVNVYAVVFRNGVLSFSMGDNPHVGHVRNRIKEHQSHMSLTSDWICYALMSVILSCAQVLH